MLNHRSRYEHLAASGPTFVTTARNAANADVILGAGTIGYMCKWLRWRADELPVPVNPCPNCGHDTSDHPWPGRKHLTACAACIWEEDFDRRRAEDICRQFSRHQS